MTALLQDFANDSSQFAAPPHLVAFAHVCEKRWKRIRKLAAAASGDGHSHDHPSYCIFSMQKGQAGDVTVSELAIRAVEQARRTATEQHTVEVPGVVHVARCGADDRDEGPRKGLYRCHDQTGSDRDEWYPVMVWPRLLGCGSISCSDSSCCNTKCRWQR